MTEAEWKACSFPGRTLDHLRIFGGVTDRKLRLAACACLRLVWDDLPVTVRAAIEVGERFLDGKASPEELSDACGRAAHSTWVSSGIRCLPAFPAQRRESRLLRDALGNPFRPAPIDPAWRTETALALAAGIYAELAHDRMPILADALQDAGCDSDDVLDHCRGPGPHVRGCWVVVLVLGKVGRSTASSVR